MNEKNLGTSIKYNRELLNLTQEKFAELVGVNPHYIYELERGLKLPSLPVLISISEVLHTGIDSLLNENTGNKHPADDELSIILKNLSTKQRHNLTKILKNLLPYLKI